MSDFIGRFASLYTAAETALTQGYMNTHRPPCAGKPCTCGFTDLWWAYDAAKRMMDAQPRTVV